MLSLRAPKRSLKAIVAAVVTASIALGSATPALADRDHRKHWRKHERVVVIDRRDHHRGHHRYKAPPRKVVYVKDRRHHHYKAPPRKVVYVKERGYDRHHHYHDRYHYRDKGNTGEVLLGVGLGAAALAGILAATND